MAPVPQLISSILSLISSTPNDPGSTPTTHTLSLIAVNNDLPAPPQSTPIYVGIGLGTQNYSCSGAGATAVSIGAYARLYSATSASSLTDITTAYVERYQSDYGITGCLLGVPACGNLINLSEQRFPTLGEHYFTETTPTFNLDGSASSQHPNVLFATVEDKVNAPSHAYAGSNDEGAVKWLYLEEDDTGRSTSDASYVYGWRHGTNMYGRRECRGTILGAVLVLCLSLLGETWSVTQAVYCHSVKDPGFGFQPHVRCNAPRVEDDHDQEIPPQLSLCLFAQFALTGSGMYMDGVESPDVKIEG